MAETLQHDQAALIARLSTAGATDDEPVPDTARSGRANAIISPSRWYKKSVRPAVLANQWRHRCCSTSQRSFVDCHTMANPEPTASGLHHFKIKDMLTRPPNPCGPLTGDCAQYLIPPAMLTGCSPIFVSFEIWARIGTDH